MLPTVGPISERGLRMALGTYVVVISFSVSNLASCNIKDRFVDLNGTLDISIDRLDAFRRSS